jgi:hypothetical protein
VRSEIGLVEKTETKCISRASTAGLSVYREWNYGPLKDKPIFQLLEPMNVTSFGKRVFADILKLRVSR